MTEDYRYKVVVDPVHGDIGLSKLETHVIDTPTFQRLRNLRQLGLASYVYPNASHTRFAHSLGVFRIMSRIIDLFVNKKHFDNDDRRKMRIAALLHDVGHYPYSHLMEYLDRDQHRPTFLSRRKSSKRNEPKKIGRYPDHEKVGQLAITRRTDLSNTLRREGGIDPGEIASIIRGEHANTTYNQLIHSSLDMDRMDYMVRDSLGTGVPYGQIDLNYLLSNLDVTKDRQVVVSYKAATAAEHFLIARYFMYKSVYTHKTIFGFEALLRQILFLLREQGAIPRDGKEIEKIVLSKEFLAFHDGYVDRLVEKCADSKKPKEVALLCEALMGRHPPKLVHEVTALTTTPDAPAEYALFTNDRADRIGELSKKFNIDKSHWIWEDPKDLKFEALGPFVPISQIQDVKPEEAAEMILIRQRDGKIRKLVEDERSIVHHLSQLRFRSSRLYVVGVTDVRKIERIKAYVQAWCRAK